MFTKFNSVYYINNFSSSNKNAIAGFDIDWTIVKPKSGKKFPKSRNDWVYLYGTKTINKLKEISKSHHIVFFSNQSKIKDEVLDKFNDIILNLKLPISVYVSTKNDYYRKPIIGMWELFTKDIKVNYDKSFYCGDAAGRENDFAATDYMFAHNINVKFLTPEQFFINSKYTYSQPKLKVPDFKKYLTDKPKELPLSSSKELIILVGYPGSGKSFLANKTGYEVINQDILKTRNKCLKETEKLMKKNKNIVIDNTNHTKNKREDYIKLGKKYGYYIKGVEISNPIELCQYMNNYRVLISKGSIKAVPIVVYRTIKKYYEKCDESEGFNEIITFLNKIKKEKNIFTYLL